MAVTNIVLPPTSAYTKTAVVSVNGQVTFGLLQPTVLPSNGDQRATVGQSDENRIDRLASKYLRNPGYWWAIAECNNMIDPLTEVTTGRVLRIPNRLTLPT